MKKEIWKDIPNWENIYQASNLGRIRSKDRIIKTKNGRSKKNGVILKQAKPHGTCQYYQVALGKYTKIHNVHRLIAYTFIGIRRDMCVNHINHIKTDNRVSNLEFVTYKENNHKARMIGKYNRKDGSYSHSQLLTKDVLKIIKMLKKGIKHEIISNKFGVSKPLISMIKNGKRWAHLSIE